MVQETRVRTRTGTLVVDDHEVRLERGPTRRPQVAIPRHQITQIRLTSRFHAMPLLLGALLLVASLSLGLLQTAGHQGLLPAAIAYSLVLVLIIIGLFCLLALPLAWQARLIIASPQKLIQVHTGYHRMRHLELAHRHLNDHATHPGDLVGSVSTPSGPHPESG
jgi:hypothetical protein